MRSVDGEAQVGYEIGPLLLAAHRKAAQAFNAALHPLRLQGRHFGVLLALHREGPLSQRELIERLGSEKSSMVRLIDHLEDLGLCQRERHPVDRRAYAVGLTDQGRAAFARAESVAEAVAAALLADLRPGEQHTLRELLTRLLATDIEPDEKFDTREQQ